MRSVAITPLLLLGTATSLWGQGNCLDQVKLPEVGRWAEYQAVYNQKDPYTLRYAVIGTENRGGKNLQWVEMRMTGDQKDRHMIYQVLVPGSLVEMSQVQEIVFKPGDQPAMKMNGMMMDMIRGQLEKQSFYGDVCKGVSLVGKESITVPAGRFETLHFRSSEYAADSWLAPDVPFSLIKSTGKQYQMELVAQGEGAMSSITEKPQEMRGMGGPSSR
jgi:hypothetical protein